ncbi:MAG: polysaccharide biosynthesis/export family protein [Tannerellaceae bacterium]|jgi:polysaccharide export outer membrane protein|nr:polysaccharide biosynthesis/export family protein [Tannerellaceae bacterium]
MKIKLLSVTGLICFMTSCGTPKDVLYFQGIDSLTEDKIAQMNQSYTSCICPDDLLTITVTAWDPTVVTPFNPPVWAYATQGEVNVTNSLQLHTYLVDTDGNITFPVIGKVLAAGFSKQELATRLQNEISRYVKDPLVNVQIVNYKVNVIGEIARPGTLTVRNERITILDAIGQLGDLTINANRRNILIVRDNNGEKEFGRIDITSTEIFASPYYYLRQNDIVYIEPNRPKQRNYNITQSQTFTVSIVSTILTTVSVLTTVIVALSKK